MQGERGPQGAQGIQGPPGVPAGSVVITPETIYREAHERYGRIESALASIRTDLHPIHPQLAEHDAYLNTLRSAGLPERFAVVESEVQTLKGRWAWAVGAGSAAAFLAGILGSFVPRLIG